MLKAIQSDPLILKVGLARQYVPDGEYLAVLESIKWDVAYKKRIVVMTFKIAEGKHAGTLVRAFINAQYETFSSHTKLYQWYANGTGEILEEGEGIDLNLMLEKIYRVRVETKTSRKTKNTFSNVVEIIEPYMDL